MAVWLPGQLIVGTAQQLTIFTVATDVLLPGQGAVPVIKYRKVDVVAPAAGVKVPEPALNVPPVPVNCVQVPPVCSPVIKLNKFIAVVELSQTEVLPSVPAFACGLTVIVKFLLAPVHPPFAGVTVMVAVTGDMLLLTAVNEAIFPLPLLAKPMEVVLLIQL